jgi:hypothetical protein
MLMPDRICRVCQRLPVRSSLDEVCSEECAERLPQTAFYQEELREAVDELNDFEEGVYLPLYLKVMRAEARLRVLRVGMSKLLRSDHLALAHSDPFEVREWKQEQSQHDEWVVSTVKRQMRRFSKKVHQLEEELKEIDQRWQSLSDRREAVLEKLSRARGE